MKHAILYKKELLIDYMRYTGKKTAYAVQRDVGINHNSIRQIIEGKQLISEAMAKRIFKAGEDEGIVLFGDYRTNKAYKNTLLVDLMTQHAISKTKICKLVNTHYPTVCRLISGGKTVTSSVVDKLKAHYPDFNYNKYEL